MATTTRSKYKQMAEEAEAAKETQEAIEESENDSDYEAEISHLTVQESEDNFDYETEDSHIMVQDITVSDISIDDFRAEFLEINKKPERKPPTKITKPKTSWVWKFFKLNEDNTKAICQINGCEKMLAWCGSPSSLSTHLSGTHHITKDIATKHEEEKLKNSSTPPIKLHNPFTQESLTKNVVGFVIGTVQPLNIVEDPDFINMINGFDKRYKVPCTKTLKNRISKTYEVGKDALKNQLTQVQYISLTLDAWSSPAHLPYLGVTAHWITFNFEPCEILLSMEELPYPHGATEIQEHLSDKDIDDLTTAMGTFWQKKNSRIATPIKDEFKHYLNVSELPALEEYDPYLWWSANKNQYPVLHKLAMKYLSIPSTSVPSERLFSDAKNLITPQRTRLDSHFINQLMFLKRNREYIDIYGMVTEEDAEEGF